MEGREAASVFTSSLRLRDEIQLAAISAGYSSSFSRCSRPGVVTAYQHRESGLVRSRTDQPDVEEMDDYLPVVASVAGWAVRLHDSQQQQQQHIARPHSAQGQCAYSEPTRLSQQRCLRHGVHRPSCTSTAPLPRVSLQEVEDSGREGSALRAPAAVWCVELRHRDHLLVARRVTERDDAGRVLAASLPVVVGNCSKAHSGRGKFDAYITSVLMPLLKGEH